MNRVSSELVKIAKELVSLDREAFNGAGTKDDKLFLRKFIRAVEKEKSKLISQARMRGISETFGQKEVRKLEDLLGSGPNFYTNSSIEMKQARKVMMDFQDWTMTYNG